jgi:hypothetical protein
MTKLINYVSFWIHPVNPLLCWLELARFSWTVNVHRKLEGLYLDIN